MNAQLAALPDVARIDQFSRRVGLIVRRVAERHGLSVQELTGSGRPRRIARPRQVAMTLALELTGYSSAEIGRAFGRDHSTVIYAREAVRNFCRRDPDFAGAYDSLRKQCGAEINGARPDLAAEQALDAARIACRARIEALFKRLTAAAERDPFGLLARLEKLPCEPL